MTIGYLIDVEFIWGFQAKIIGLSKTSPSFYYPPPTTFLGALAEVIAKENQIGENKGREIIPKIAENLLAIGLRPINCVPLKCEDLNRIIALKLTGGEIYPDPRNLRSSFDSPASGKTIFSTYNYEAPIIRWFLVFKNETFNLNNKTIKLDENIFWKIHRLGSRESLVSCSNVKRVKVEVIHENAFTKYSFPLLRDLILKKEIEGRWEKEVYIDPFRIKSYIPLKSYIFSENLITYFIPMKASPLSEPEYHIELRKGIVSYSYKDEEVTVGRWLE
jgi:CRISPR-associated protein Cas5a/b/c